MAKPYSGDLREAVVRSVRAGHSHSAVAAMFKIGERSVRRYMALWRATGSVDSLMKFGGHMKYALADHAKTVEQLVRKNPDATLEDLRDALAQQTVVVSKSALDRFLKVLGLSYKKNAGRSRAETQRRGPAARGLAKSSGKA